jgi:hypothetical protein
VAVIIVILHSYFTRRLERVAARLEVIAGHLLHEFYKHGGASLYEKVAVTELEEPDEELVEAIEQSGQEVEQSDFLK